MSFIYIAYIYYLDCRAVLGKGHPDTIASMHNLAELLLAVGTSIIVYIV